MTARERATRLAACLAIVWVGACGVQISGGSGVTTTSDTTATGGAGATGGASTGTGAGGAAPACKADGTLCSRKEECCTNACSGKFCGPGAGLCHPGDPPVVIASNDTGIYTLTIDPEYVYYSTPHGGSCDTPAKVLRVPKQGGTPEIVATPTLVPNALAVDETRLFWPDQSGVCGGTGYLTFSLFIGPKDGDPAGNTISIGTKDYDARGIALDATHAYFIYAPFYVYRAEKSSGWSMPLGYEENWAESIAIDDTMVYWSCDFGLRRCPKDGKGDAENLADYEFRFAQLAVDADALYVSNPIDGEFVKGQIYRMSKDGATTTPLATLVGERPGRIAMDDTHVYWATVTPFVAGTPSVGHIMRVAKTGGEVVTLAEGQDPGAIAVDDSCVYWTDSGQLMRGPK